MRDIFLSLPLKQSEPDYICQRDAVVKRFNNAKKKDYELICDTVVNNGYTLFSETKIENNEAKTFFSQDKIIHCLYSPNEQCVRVSISSEKELYLNAPQKCERVCDTVVYQFETDHSLIDCGMCYIIRCCDSSFFIIDSAHLYSVNDNDRLHDFLRSLTPVNERIKICGWFFSHAHEDHVCKFMDYLKYNCYDTDIEAVYCNILPINHRDCNNWENSTKNIAKNFCELIYEHTEIKKIIPRTLQKIYVRNLCINVLCTHEDVYPESVADFNDSSTVIMIEAEGSKVFFPGDASRKESDILEKRFLQYLKCDIVQLSHHGHTGLKSEIYKRAAAECLLIPNTRIKFDEEWTKREENRVAMSYAKENYLSADGTVGIKLPYTPYKTQIFADETTENFDGIFALWGYEYTDEFKRKIKEDFIKRSKK